MSALLGEILASLPPSSSPSSSSSPSPASPASPASPESTSDVKHQTVRNLLQTLWKLMESSTEIEATKKEFFDVVETTIKDANEKLKGFIKKNSLTWFQSSIQAKKMKEKEDFTITNGKLQIIDTSLATIAPSNGLLQLLKLRTKSELSKKDIETLFHGSSKPTPSSSTTTEKLDKKLDAPWTPVEPTIFQITGDDAEKQKKELKNYFEENGYAVIKIEEIDGFEKKFWSWLKSLNCALPDTYPTTPEGLQKYREQLPINPFNGIINGKEKIDGTNIRTGIGQSELVWSVRGHPTVRTIFETLLDSKDLRVSFDSANAFFVGIAKDESRWWHVDQQSSTILSIQGLYNARPASADTGGFLCLPKSHKNHADVMLRVKPKPDQQFIRVNDKHEPLFQSLTPTLVCAPAHCVTVWDSRMIHCNTTGLKWDIPQSPTDPLLRLVAYVSMCEAKRLTPKIEKERIKIYLKGGTANHMPYDMKEKAAPNVDRTGFIIKPDETNPTLKPIPLTEKQLELLCDKSLWGGIPKHLVPEGLGGGGKGGGGEKKRNRLRKINGEWWKEAPCWNY